MIENFTPLSALAGGALIGLASLGIFALFGRVSGISGILGRLIEGARDGLDWRVGFGVGLVAAPLIYSLFVAAPIVFESSASLWVLALAGVLVGFGTRLGNGCTSGHGISGISRFSLRSLIATCTFVGVAVLVNFVV